MATLDISAATSISFYVETGTGRVNDGASLDANYAYTDAGITDYYNCDSLKYVDNRCQQFNCADITAFQFRWENTDKYPEVVIFDDETDANIGTLSALWVSQDEDGIDYYNVDIDFSDVLFTCGGCYTIKIRLLDMDTVDAICWADSGTINFVTGGFNTLAVSVGIFRTGVQSTKCTAPAVPAFIDRTIGYCDNLALVADTYYVHEVYVYEVDNNDGFTHGLPVALDITDFSDAVTILEQKANPLIDGYGVWHLVRTVFKTGTDVAGSIYIRTPGLFSPKANGNIYLDDLALSHASAVKILVEATSQKICLETSHNCTVGITYYSDTNSFGMVYDAPTVVGSVTDAPLVNFIRIGATYHQFHMEDPNRETDENSERTALSVQSANQKIRTFRAHGLPEYAIEKIALALKHKTMQIDGVDYVCVTDNITPEWGLEDDTTATIEVDLRLKSYDYQSTNC